MQKQNSQLRQGDVLLIKIDKLPKGLEAKNKILAYGEVTGHKHQFLVEQATVLADKKGSQFVNTQSDCELVHEEHKNLTVPKGLYKVVLQREYDLIEGVRQVLD